MSWTLLIALVACLGIMLFASVSRRAELRRMAETVEERERARRRGSDQAKLNYPVIDLSRCLGCATCVAVCPEEGVLEIVHGQAVVVNGSRCEGISACERECPVGAVTVTIANLEERDDIPALTPQLEAVGSPGLFVAGELSAHALIKTAIEQGTKVGEVVAERVGPTRAADPEVLDLCIVGAGPAGLACSLVARREGLSFVTLDREEAIGGTVAKYPRQKLVMTQPVEMPMYGRFGRSTYLKEELIALWQGIAAEQQLPIAAGEALRGLDRSPDGTFVVHTERGDRRARNVCLAIGRRGEPNELGVPGESLPKVAYSLIDAGSYSNCRVLIVGGGDSAVEAALALSERGDNAVTLSYRRADFFRLKARNESELRAAVEAGRIELLLESDVLAIHPDQVELRAKGPGGPIHLSLPNDFVFVMAGGRPPFDLVRAAGVSFDSSARPEPPVIEEQGTGLTRAIGSAFLLALVSLLWAVWHADYYGLELAERPANLKHDLLRPSDGIGLGLGIAAVVMVVVNLAYLPRRSPNFDFQWGSLQRWMTSHVATGVLALLCAILHAAMSPRDTAGGHAFLALVLLLITGVVGRYFYAFVPRATNGRELELDEVKSSLGRLAEEFDDGYYRFRERVREEIGALVSRSQWRSTLTGRIAGVLTGQRQLRRTLHTLEDLGRQDGVPEAKIRETLFLARKAHRSATMLAHYEDLRGLIGSWRFLHRWGALAMVILMVMHIVMALAYS